MIPKLGCLATFGENQMQVPHTIYQEVMVECWFGFALQSQGPLYPKIIEWNVRPRVQQLKFGKAIKSTAANLEQNRWKKKESRCCNESRLCKNKWSQTSMKWRNVVKPTISFHFSVVGGLQLIPAVVWYRYRRVGTNSSAMIWETDKVIHKMITSSCCC